MGVSDIAGICVFITEICGDNDGICEHITEIYDDIDGCFRYRWAREISPDFVSLSPETLTISPDILTISSDFVTESPVLLKSKSPVAPDITGATETLLPLTLEITSAARDL